MGVNRVKQQKAVPGRALHEDSLVRIQDVFPSSMDMLDFQTFNAQFVPSYWFRIGLHFHHLFMAYYFAFAMMGIIQALNFNAILDLYQWYVMSILTFAFQAFYFALTVYGAMDTANHEPQPCVENPNDAYTMTGIQVNPICVPQHQAFRQSAFRYEIINRMLKLTWDLLVLGSVILGVALVMYRNRNNGTADVQTYLNNAVGAAYTSTNQISNVVQFVVANVVFFVGFMWLIGDWVKLLKFHATINRYNHPVVRAVPQNAYAMAPVTSYV